MKRFLTFPIYLTGIILEYIGIILAIFGEFLMKVWDEGKDEKFKQGLIIGTISIFAALLILFFVTAYFNNVLIGIDTGKKLARESFHEEMTRKVNKAVEETLEDLRRRGKVEMNELFKKRINNMQEMML